MKLFYISIFLVFISCKGSIPEKQKANHTNGEVTYAKGFSITTQEDKTIIEVYNPWDNYNLLSSYELVKKGTPVTSASQIEVPVKSITSLSSTYLGMLEMLNARDKVIAASSANWIYDSLLYKRYQEGKITDLGNDLNVNAEAVIASSPDVVLRYIYQSPDPIDPIITNAGINLVYIIEFMEEHPLGRAEWIKVVGALLDKREEADSLFNLIESNYNETKALAQKVSDHPKVVTGSVYKGTWYAAGGKSYVARLIKDAGADYLCSGDTSTGSIPLSLEYVLQEYQAADFWINVNAKSLDDIHDMEPRVEILKAFQQGNVYYYSKRENPNGGLDYYESGIIRPDLLLRDLVSFLHKNTEQNETIYYKKLD